MLFLLCINLFYRYHNNIQVATPHHTPADGSASTQRFDRPAVDANGTALAWCLGWQAGVQDAQQCGDPAAAAFCTRHGFDSVADAAGPLHVQEPTLSPSTGLECAPAEWGQCDTFAYIVCSRQPAR